MLENRKINCNVFSCKYNNTERKQCELEEIHVMPCEGCDSGNPEDESMCGSYEQD